MPRDRAGTLSLDTSRLPGHSRVKVAATDAADQASDATSTLRVDRTAPAPPGDLVVMRNADGTLALLWKNPDQGSAAPIAAARYEVVCERAGSGCAGGPWPAAQGLARSTSLAMPGGEHIVKVWLQDEAGNADPANAATLTFDPSKLTSRTVNTNPPVLTAGPAPSPRLRSRGRAGRVHADAVRDDRSGGERTDRGSGVAEQTGKPVLAKARVKPKRGKWTARVKLPARCATGGRCTSR